MEVPAIKSWKPRLERWATEEQTYQHEDKLFLALTLLIGALVGLVIAGFILLTENFGSRMYPTGGAAWQSSRFGSSPISSPFISSAGRLGNPSGSPNPSIRDNRIPP